jgi:hypothetical protein
MAIPQAAKNSVIEHTVCCILYFTVVSDSEFWDIIEEIFLLFGKAGFRMA